MDNVLCRGHRVIIPDGLRSVVLDTLHAAHQGVSGIEARAATSVWWLGMKADIAERRARCEGCNVSAPSQPSAPLYEMDYPMQSICSDIAYMGD